MMTMMMVRSQLRRRRQWRRTKMAASQNQARINLKKMLKIQSTQKIRRRINELESRYESNSGLKLCLILFT